MELFQFILVPMYYALGLKLKEKTCAAAGNLLANAEIASIMVACFETTNGQLADRLLAA
jgi:uncharacterized Ntn-hydrolase superfamily protein